MHNATKIALMKVLQLEIARCIEVDETLQVRGLD